MTDRMVIPDEAVKYILFQRTTYLRFPVAAIYRRLDKYLPFETPLYNIVVAVEARLRASTIKALYEEDMKREFDSIRDFLPTSCSAVLDIGCGVAGIDLFIYRHCSDQDIDLYLLDKTQLEKTVFYMFKSRGAFYNSLNVARRTLTANSVPPHSIHLVEANDTNDIPVGVQVDLVLSLLSWGFHYPLGTYLDQVRDILSEEGVVIVDVRKGTDGMDVLGRTFRQVDVIFEVEKRYRVAARK